MRFLTILAVLVGLTSSAFAQFSNGCSSAGFCNGGVAAAAIPNYTINQALPKWQACRNAVIAQTPGKVCKELSIGDSFTGGSDSAWNGSVAARAQSYPSELAAALYAVYGLNTSSNAVFGDAALTTAAAYVAYDPRVTAGGSWIVNTGAGITAIGGNPWSASATSKWAFNPSNPVQFPSATVLQTDTFTYFLGLYNGGDQTTITVNGGAALATHNDGSSSLLKNTVSTTLGNNSWEVNCTNTGAAGCFFLGGYAYNSAVPQILFLNGAIFGSGTTQWASSATPYAPINGIQSVAPDLCIIELGGADAIAGTAQATFIANLNAIIAACKVSGDVLMVTSKPGDPSVVSYATQNTYMGYFNSVAASNNLSVYDQFASLCGWNGSTCAKGGWTIGGQMGWLPGNFGNSSTGNVHSGTPNYTTLANTLAQILMR